MPKTSSTMGGGAGSLPEVPALPNNYLEMTDEQLEARLVELRAARGNLQETAARRGAARKSKASEVLDDF